MLVGSRNSCIEKYVRKKMITSSNYDAEAVKRKAAEMCKSMDADNLVMSQLNQLLSQYADTMASLADKELPSYKEELTGLESSLIGIQRRNNDGTYDALLDADKVGAVISLSEFLSRIATQRVQRNAIKELMGHEAAVFTIVDALTAYATANYRGWLSNEKLEMAPLRASLQESSSREPLAANQARAVLEQEERQLEAKDQAITLFVNSADKLKKTHVELRENLDTLDDRELTAQLNAYAKDVSALRKQLRDAF